MGFYCAAITELGPFEIAPGRTRLDLACTTQPAVVGPATDTGVEIGLHVTDLAAVVSSTRHMTTIAVEAAV